jgi:copper chaperone NosL
MTIADPRFSGEVVTKKGRIYKFDDITCLKKYLLKEGEDKMAHILIADFTDEHSLHSVKESFYVQFKSINSPMQGNIIALKNKDSAGNYAQKHNAKVESWTDIKK